VRFVFGCDARANLIGLADAVPPQAWTPLERRPAYEVRTAPRERPANVKAAIIVDREFKDLRLEAEAVGEFAYQPVACEQPYRMVAIAWDRAGIGVAPVWHAPRACPARGPIVPVRAAVACAGRPVSGRARPR
jgi:hypothetical protein